MSGIKLRLLIGAIIVIFSFISYLGSSQVNPVTDQVERVGMTINDEIALGQQQAPRMGHPSRDYQSQMQVDAIGARLVRGFEEKYLTPKNKRNPFQFEFTLLSDPANVNAFALPGGQVFITDGLFHRLTEAQVAGVLAHEMGHVIERHSAKQMAKSGFIGGVTGAAGIVGGDPSSSHTAASLGKLLTLRYSRDAEFEADAWSVRVANAAGYDPSQMIAVLETLKQLSDGNAPPEFLSTHPSSDSRIESIRQVIAKEVGASRIGSDDHPRQILQQFN
jgi:predicted Zn-dependent protease